MKKLISIVCSLIVMTAVTAGCSQKPSSNVKDDALTVQSTTVENTTTAVTTETPAPANVDPNAAYDYEVREMSGQRRSCSHSRTHGLTEALALRRLRIWA